LHRPGVQRNIELMTNLRSCVALAVLVVLVGACASGAGPAGSAAPASGAASGAGSSGGSSGQPGGTVDTADEAAALVIASDSRFKNVGKKDRNLIGQCCWYEAAAGQEGFRVKITMGWGDCPAGCINSHVWTYEVTRAGEITLIDESGDPVEPGAFGS
jgi:hypothetical protein